MTKTSNNLLSAICWTKKYYAYTHAHNQTKKTTIISEWGRGKTQGVIMHKRVSKEDK